MKKMSVYSESELILNPDGSIFHLRLFPEQIADTILLVGDPGRVASIGNLLSGVENLASNREFVSVSGYFNNTKMMVISTGIGTDNMDIVVNELDALANIDLETRMDRTVRRSLNLIRIGTSGSLQADIPAGSSVAAAWSVGLDGLMKYYMRPNEPEREAFELAFLTSANWPVNLPEPYAAKASPELLRLVESHSTAGITIAAHGFYGPQGRQLRARLAQPDLNLRLQSFRFNGLRTTNFEMESSALYGLGQLLDHKALTICLIIANRMTGDFLGDYSSAMNTLILDTLNSLTTKVN